MKVAAVVSRCPLVREAWMDVDGRVRRVGLLFLLVTICAAGRGFAQKSRITNRE